MKRAFKLVALAAIPIMSVANVSFYREAAYLTTLYSDATHSQIVGYITPECGFRYVQYGLVGTYSVYGVDEFVGYCTENGWEQI